MKVNQILKTSLASMLILCMNSPVFAETITETTVSSLNNESTSGTYKIDSFDKYLTNINFSSSVVNKSLEKSYKNVQGYSSEVSWLLENDIISKDDVFSSDGYNVETESTNYCLSDFDSDELVNKSDVVMSTCKALYGVQDSRPIIIKSKSLKPYVVTGDDVIDHSEGNYSLFITPNVYELYFTTMLDKGFISINEFKNVKFIKDYNDLKSQNKPSWFYTDKSYFTLTGSSDYPLGQTIRVSNSGFTCSSEFYKPNYFYSESINKMDVYKLIERLLRTTESDMSNTEAEIISYKYGVDYLSYLDTDSKNCIMYLLAMGIIDFEDTSEMEHLFEPMKCGDFLETLYRLANKNARKDFKSVQLTDDDNYNLKNGFMQATVTLNGPTPKVLSVTKSDEIAQTSSSNFLVSSRINPIHAGNSNYTVKVALESEAQYKYMNESLSSLQADAEKGIKSITTSGDSVIVEFTVDAPNEAAALRMISERITSNHPDTKVAKINSLASVTSNGQDYEYYIPKSALQSLNGKDNTEIVALADKYLVNQKTNTSALFLDDDKLAMVGNEVIETEKADIRGINGEVYYNIKIISRLMSNSYISKLKSSDISSEPLGSSGSLEDQKYADVVNYKTTSVLDKTLTAKANTQGTLADKGVNTEKSYMSILHAQNLNSCIYRKIDKDTIMVVKWQYALPEYDTNTQKHQLSDNSIGKLAQQYNIGNPSVSEMNSFLTEEPKDQELKTWWDSNIGLSNSLCNYIYKTSGKKYFSNGYLAPSVTFLHNGDALNEDKMKDILSDLEFPADYKSEFLQGGVNPAKALFGQGTGMYGSLAQTRSLESYGSSDLEDDAVDYEGRFLEDRTGCLYESILSDVNNLDCHNQMMQLKDDGKVRVVPRKSVDSSLIKANREYKLNGETLICGGEEYFNGTSNRVYKMYLKTPLKGTVECDSDGYYRYYVNGDDDKELNSWYGNIIDQFSDDSMYRGMQHDYIVSTGPMEGLSEQGTPAKYFTCNNKNIYEQLNLNKDEQYVVKDDGSNNLKEIEIEIGDSEDDVYLTPVFYLNVNKWACDGENLVESQLTPMTVRENLISIGLSRSVQDSIIAKCYDCEPCSELPDDSRVIIGDMNFTVKNGKLISDPVRNSTAISQLSSSTDASTVVSATSKLFDGISLFNSNNSSSGALSEHITNKGGNRSIGLYSLKAVDKGYTTLMSDGCNLTIRTSDGSKAFKAGDTFDSFVFYVEFDNGVKFKPIDTDSKTYTILYVTDEGVNGTLSDIPYFTDELSYKWDLDIFGETGLNSFKAANDVLGLMDSIKKAYDAAFRKDIKGLITIFFLNILAYLIVMVFVVGVLSKQPSVINLLRKLSNPGGDLRGVDLFKFLTFGMFTVEDDPSLVKCLGTDGVLILILVIFVKLAY